MLVAMGWPLGSLGLFYLLIFVVIVIKTSGKRQVRCGNFPVHSQLGTAVPKMILAKLSAPSSILKKVMLIEGQQK